jgi:hypothetical protein
MSKKVSPTQRTLAECKRRGWIAQVVEQTIPHTFIKRDLFGVIDIIAITPDGIIGIQATAGKGNHAKRVAKAVAEPRLSAWLRAGAMFGVWSWALQGARGEVKRWTLREENFAPAVAKEAA